MGGVFWGAFFLSFGVFCLLGVLGTYDTRCTSETTASTILKIIHQFAFCFLSMSLSCFCGDVVGVYNRGNTSRAKSIWKTSCACYQVHLDQRNTTRRRHDGKTRVTTSNIVPAKQRLDHDQKRTRRAFPFPHQLIRAQDRTGGAHTHRKSPGEQAYSNVFAAIAI